MVQQHTSTLISNRHARRIFMERQGLIARPTPKQSKSDLKCLIHKLGFVQIDSIATVERAHHMILFARNQTYQPKHLACLLEQDRAMFENWTHDAAIIPTEFYPNWQRRFERDAATLRARWRKWQRIGFEDILEDMVQHIAENGPAMSRSFKRNSKPSGGGWWDWDPSKTALEYLWRTGRIAITRRDAFQKVYDLTERVIPDEHRRGDRRNATPDDETLINWCCRSALERLGFATPGELAAFWGIVTAGEAREWALSAAGHCWPRVLVETADGSKPRQALAHPSALALDQEALNPPPRLRVISPFDPVIRDRKRLKRLFNYDYRIEVFVPEVKRTFGYYVFPLLEGDRFVGRIDMKRDTKTGKLTVTGLWWEAGIKPSKGRLAKLDAELARVARFIDCPDIDFHCPRT